MRIETNNIQVRQLRKEEIEQSLRLASFAFQYTIPKEEWETAILNEVPAEVWGGFDGDQLVAQVRIRPLRTYLQGRIVEMGGIAAVASWPEYRRGGIVASLLIRSLSVMKEAGQSISFLTPFSFAFYRRYGWETYTDRKRLTVETALLPRIESARVPGQVVRVDQDIDLLSPLYELYASKFNGMLNRSKEWSKELLERKKGQVSVYRDVQGVPQGYVHYQVKSNELFIHELITLNHEAQLGLWRYIANHDSMIQKVVYMAPSNDSLSFLLDNPRIKQEIEPYFMARVVDVEKLIEQYSFLPSMDRKARWSENKPVSLSIHIHDPYALWNDGLWELTVAADGSATISRMEADQHTALMPLSCDIQTLSTLLMGYMRANYLYEIGRLQGDRDAAQLLEAIVPESTTFLSDFF
jgi:predicted acetyltransferase